VAARGSTNNKKDIEMMNENHFMNVGAWLSRDLVEGKVLSTDLVWKHTDGSFIFGDDPKDDEYQCCGTVLEVLERFGEGGYYAV
jgi:hypothetical protein